MTVDIIPRGTWGAYAPTGRRQLKSFDNGWFIHWLGTPNPPERTDPEILRNTQRFHMKSRGWDDIAYSFAIGRTGRIYELRGWGITGAHTEGYNSTSMAIVFLVGTGETVTVAMLDAATALLAEGTHRGYTNKIRPHKAVNNTQCPGPILTAWATNQPTPGDTMADRSQQILAWQRAIAAHGADLGPTGIDGDFGPKTLAASLALLGQIGRSDPDGDRYRQLRELLGIV